ncbi:hypothetical protein BDY24DRAFT_405069 [Mrakia frigida]|uniref:zinc finger MYND domain-containing protein n=1 Tax=Mrakia frigida TaxID=29902 RepID=UPI003FCC1934
MSGRWDNLATELSVALKLDDEQFQAVRGRRTGYEGAALIMDLIPTLSEKGEDEKAATVNFTKFLALHLPRLVEAYSELLARISSTAFGPSLGNHPWTSLFDMVSPHPLFTRWARENEKVSYRFATTITKTFIGSSFPMDFTRRNISKATLQSLQAVDSFTTFLLDTIVSFPPPPSPSTTPPTFPAAHRHQFASSMEQVGYVMSTYEQQPQLQLTPNERDRIEATFKILYCVRRFMRATSTDAWREELTQLGGYVRWYECEGIAVFSTGQCVELKEGEVMQACGGCGAVSYCCKAHQKAHWKAHKTSCWKPMWCFVSYYLTELSSRLEVVTERTRSLVLAGSTRRVVIFVSPPLRFLYNPGFVL